MVGTIQVGDEHFSVTNVKPANRAVVQYKPGFQSVGGLAPGQVEHCTNQVSEESPMTHEDDILFGLTIAVAVPCKQLCPNALRPQLAFLFCFERAVIPPANAIQT